MLTTTRGERLNLPGEAAHRHAVDPKARWAAEQAALVLHGRIWRNMPASARRQRSPFVEVRTRRATTLSAERTIRSPMNLCDAPLLAAASRTTPYLAGLR